jgi:hypothetical protein
VTKVDAFTWKQATPAVESSRLKLTLSAADVDPWREWLQRSTSKLSGEEVELPGSIALLDPFQRNVLGRFVLMNVGILSTDRATPEPQFLYELYFRQIAFEYAAGY